MKGCVGFPSICSHPGYNAQAQNPPIFKPAHNHTFRAGEKFIAHSCESTNTRVVSCRSTIRLFSPDVELVSNTNYLCKKGQVSSDPRKPKPEKLWGWGSLCADAPPLGKEPEIKGYQLSMHATVTYLDSWKLYSPTFSSVGWQEYLPYKHYSSSQTLHHESYLQLHCAFGNNRYQPAPQ